MSELTEEQRRVMRRAAREDRVAVMMGRDDWLRLIGFLNAHRPPGDWEPGFLSTFLLRADQAVNGEG